MTNDKLSKALVAFIALLMIGASGIALAGCNNTDSKDNDDTSQHGDNGDTDGDIIKEVVKKLEFENKYYDYLKFDKYDPETTFYDKPCMIFMYNGPTDEYSNAVKNEMKVVSTIDLENLTEEEKQTLKDLGYNGTFTFTNEMLVPEKNAFYGGISWCDLDPNGNSRGLNWHGAIEQYLDAKYTIIKDSDGNVIDVIINESIGLPENWAVNALEDLKKGSLMGRIIANFEHYTIISLEEYEAANLIGIGLSDDDKTEEEKQIENQSTNTNSTSIPYVPGARERNYNPKYVKKLHK